jgi:transposase-like protein
MDQRQMNAAAMILQGKPFKEIALELDVSPQTLYLWRQGDEFQTYMRSLRDAATEQVKEIIAAESVAAVNTVVALQRGAQSEKIKLAAAQDILDRAGFGAVNKVAHAVQHTVTPELIDLIKELMSESKVAQATVVNEIMHLPERAGA